MPVIVTLSTGETFRLDRGLSVSAVAEKVNASRGKNNLVTFDDNRTPSRPVHFDPDLVSSIRHDGHNY